MNKIHLKKQKKLKIINLIAILIISLIISIILIFSYIKKQIMPSIYKYGTIEAKKFSSIIINDAIDKYISKQIDIDKLFKITYDKNNEIKDITLNTNIINSYLTKATKSIQRNLKYIEKGDIKKIEYQNNLLENYNEKDLKNGIIYYLNTGFIFNNPIFSNFGGQIPIKLDLTGDIISNITTKIDNYGINNALIKVYVNLKISQQIILPYFKKDIVLETKVPVVIKIINGTVPNYYGNLNSTPITIPNK